MKHRAHKLRRRYGRSGRYRIEFGTGLVETAKHGVAPGVIYAMGASSSPDLIEVVYVTDDRIGYKKPFGRDASTKVIERWIGEDLIARGEKTFKERYGVSPQRWTTMNENERREQLRGRL